ncbi:MAG: glycosyltransferase [Bacteroidia bacterium]|nr:glycosyltransferase [Bacteroidia bacterium]
MKKIMVFDVPAEHGGVLSILNDYYNDVRASKEQDTEWCFVLGKATLEETKNIKVLRFPWVKKSWFHRLFFDHIVAPRLIQDYIPDMIMSLQSVIIPHVSVYQELYLQQSLPFADYRFKIREDFLFWMYQNVIGPLIFHSIRKTNRVIVQTHWMKKACIKKTGVDGSKITVTPPKIIIYPKKLFTQSESSLSTFFYPAAPYTYKNHTLILDAAKSLVEQGFTNFHVVFTLSGEENKYAKMLFRRSKKEKLPIDFVGSLTREDVFEYYTHSVLLFPSYIETFGLPMLEAKIHNGIILASNCAFSHEILDGYDNAYFFDPFDYKFVSDLMLKILEGKINYVEESL